ncbi:MAG: MFS transporter [Dehalococcoidia bacterium]|nr:MFS transporter [Dehalococcoidia bacterium]MDW8120477.1 MFS transporter [Chloroflexota bacterium]
MGLPSPVREGSGLRSIGWLAGISAAMLLVLLPFASYVAALPIIRQEWGLTNAQAGALFSAYLLGFALASLVVVPLTDRWPPERVFTTAVMLSIVTNVLFPLLADNFWSGLLFRFLAGVALVGVYVPGIRIVAHRFRHRGRGGAVGTFVSAFYAGSSASLALMGALLLVTGWRSAYLTTAALGGLALFLAIPLVGWGKAGEQDAGGPRGRLDLRALTQVGPLLVIVGYAMHTWELYIARVWLAPFLADLLQARGREPEEAISQAATLSSIMLAAGVVAPFVGGLLSDRVGRTLGAMSLAAVSGAVSFALGWLGGVPLGMLVGVGILYGFAIAADSAIYSTAITEEAMPSLLGSTLALHTFLGFLTGVGAPIAAGRVLDAAPQGLRWGFAFGLGGVGALMGISALSVLHIRKRRSAVHAP